MIAEQLRQDAEPPGPPASPPTPLGALLEDLLGAQTRIRERLAEQRRKAEATAAELELVTAQIGELRALLWAPRLNGATAAPLTDAPDIEVEVRLRPDAQVPAADIVEATNGAGEAALPEPATVAEPAAEPERRRPRSTTPEPGFRRGSAAGRVLAWIRADGRSWLTVREIEAGLGYQRPEGAKSSAIAVALTHLAQGGQIARRPGPDGGPFQYALPDVLPPLARTALATGRRHP